MSTRRNAREILLKLVYIGESRGMHVKETFDEMSAVDRAIEESGDSEEKKELRPFSGGLDSAQEEYVRYLGKRIEEHSEELNTIISPLLKNWQLSRVSRIDRIIMCIALAEMIYMPDIPTTVSINEAIELGKQYSSEKSPAFINGVLDAALKTLDSPDNMQEQT